METREYHTIDKADWGPGPWQHEPDKLQWRDEATGLPCLIVRQPHLGHYCGYVGVDETHPLYGHPPDDVEHLEAHGGVNYADKCMTGRPEAEGICHVPGPGEPDHVWWFGFDCAHAGDLSPKVRAILHDLPPLRSGETYRDLAYLKQQVTDLARQLRGV